MEFAPQTVLGITMSSHVHNRIWCCNLEELDSRAPNFKSTKLEIKGRVQALFFHNGVSMWGYLRYCSSVSMWSSFITHLNLRHSRRTSKNLHIQEMCCLPPFFFVIDTGFATCSPSSSGMCSEYIQPYIPPSPPYRSIICSKVGLFLIDRPCATVIVSPMNLLVLLLYCSINSKAERG